MITDMSRLKKRRSEFVLFFKRIKEETTNRREEIVFFNWESKCIDGVWCHRSSFKTVFSWLRFYIYITALVLMPESRTIEKRRQRDDIYCTLCSWARPPPPPPTWSLIRGSPLIIILTLIHTIDAYIHRLTTGDESNTDRSCMHIWVGYIGTFTAAACARGHMLTGRLVNRQT